MQLHVHVHERHIYGCVFLLRDTTLKKKYGELYVNNEVLYILCNISLSFHTPVEMFSILREQNA